MIAEIKADIRARGRKRLPFAAYAAYAANTAKTPRERKLADLMLFVVRYRLRRPGAFILFPQWLPEKYHKRLLDFAERG